MKQNHSITFGKKLLSKKNYDNSNLNKLLMFCTTAIILICYSIYMGSGKEIDVETFTSFLTISFIVYLIFFILYFLGMQHYRVLQMKLILIGVNCLKAGNWYEANVYLIDRQFYYFQSIHKNPIIMFLIGTALQKTNHRDLGEKIIAAARETSPYLKDICVDKTLDDDFYHYILKSFEQLNDYKLLLYVKKLWSNKTVRILLIGLVVFIFVLNLLSQIAVMITNNG